MTPLFVLILILAIAWRQRHPPTGKITVTFRKRRERPKPARPVKRTP
jgi:hypothetical protein